MLNDILHTMEDSELAEAFALRHGIESAMTLTVTTEDTADDIAAFLADRVRGKTVVEIGGGIGLLAMHVGLIAKRVFVIEASPAWATVYVENLHRFKPKNVTFIFGSAEEMAGIIKADVAFFCTHSAADQMADLARLFAPVVIDVYGEVLAEMEKRDGPNPLTAFRSVLRSEFQADY